MATRGIRMNRVKRHKLVTTLAVGLSAASMAVPAVAAARPAVGPTAGSAISTGRPTVTQDAAPAPAAPGITLHRDGSKAAPFVADVSPTEPAVESGNGFDWGDAMIGAGGAIALIAVVGAGGLTVRSRRHAEPAATAHS